MFHVCVYQKKKQLNKLRRWNYIVKMNRECFIFIGWTIIELKVNVFFVVCMLVVFIFISISISFVVARSKLFLINYLIYFVAIFFSPSLFSQHHSYILHSWFVIFDDSIFHSNNSHREGNANRILYAHFYHL